MYPRMGIIRKIYPRINAIVEEEKTVTHTHTHTHIHTHTHTHTNTHSRCREREIERRRTQVLYTQTHTHSLVCVQLFVELGAQGHAEIVGLHRLVGLVVVVELGDLCQRKIVEAHVDSVVQDRKILKLLH